MMPALMPGETVIVDTDWYRLALPARGDIAAVHLKTRSRSLLKRIVAVAGDALGFNESAVTLNGSSIEEPYLRWPRRWPSSEFTMLAKQISRSGGVVPPDHVVVLGDSPTSEEDSSRYGLVAVDQLLGKVVAAKDRSGQIISREGLPSPSQFVADQPAQSGDR